MLLRCITRIIIAIIISMFDRVMSVQIKEALQLQKQLSSNSQSDTNLQLTNKQ